MSKSKKLIHVAARYLSRLIPYLLLGIVSVPLVGMAFTEVTKYLGLRPIPVQVVGTGSMYPSLFWSTEEGGPEDQNQIVVEEYRSTPKLYRKFTGLSLAGHTFFRRSIGFGDIVSFKNAQTATILKESNKDIAAGFIKRVIGLPGDTIELRDGFVYRNGQLIEEPYLPIPRSTYGGTSLKECVRATIPLGSYFVLGDNRKVSSDSRFELGYIQYDDIDFILPYSSQKIYEVLWRDPSKDSDLLGQPTLIASEFLALVNTVRTAKKADSLKLVASLSKSASLRGDRLLLSPSSGFDMKQAMSEGGYSNVVIGEFVSYGHYTAKELLDSLLYHPSTAKQIMSQDFSDLGIADISRSVDGCPTQVIVGHLGGYLPANYDSDVVLSWQNLRDNLAEVLPSWEEARGYNNIDHSKLDALIAILRRRLDLATEVISVMNKKEWLSVSQQDRIKADANDADIAEQISKELNKE